MKAMDKIGHNYATVLSIALLFTILLGSAAAGQPQPRGRSKEKALHQHYMKPPISEVLQKHTSELLKISGVIGVGEGRSEDKPAIVLFTESEKTGPLPKEIEGYPVVVENTGTIRPLEH